MLLSGKKVFIIEDNPGNLAIATVYLKQQGAIIHFAQFGDEAVRRLGKLLPIDVILMDLMLPKNESGFNVFQTLKAMTEFQNIPIIAVSASDADVAIPRALELGFSGYIAKPITSKISAHIADVLAGKQVWIGDSLY